MACYAEQNSSLKPAEGISGANPFCVTTSVGFLVGDNIVKTKVCSKCNTWKEVTEFGPSEKGKNGLTASCKMCLRKYAAWYRQRCPEKTHVAIRKYCKNNREKINMRNQQWRKENPEKSKLACSNWYKSNKVQYLDYLKAYRQNNWECRLRQCIHASIYHTLGKIINGANMWELVGYDYKELMSHIESQFRSGMSWENYGKWEIDHIIPRSFFQYTSPIEVEFRMCWRLDNLQPLWLKENRRKPRKILVT